MASEPVVIPEKIYFKIGEVCDLLGVQAHVLRYWETEFPMLSPQKNKSGQRSYRRRDVEMALRIKQLLYNEMFTIAGARKKLQSDLRDGSKPKAAPAPATGDGQSSRAQVEAPTLFDAFNFNESPGASTPHADSQRPDGEAAGALKKVATQLLEIREMLRTSPIK